MIPQCEQNGVTGHRPTKRRVCLNLAATDPGPVAAEVVEEQVGNELEEVDLRSDAYEDGKQRRLNVVAVQKKQRSDGLKEWQVFVMRFL